MLARIKHSARLAAKEVQIFFRKPRQGPKVFCVGFNKTGTTESWKGAPNARV